MGRTSRAVITGACGFVGAALMRRLAADGWDVVGIDLPELVCAGARALLGHDLTERLPPRTFEGVDLVIHAAALAGVRPSWSRPRDYWRANVHATRLIRESCEQAEGPARDSRSRRSRCMARVEAAPRIFTHQADLALRHLQAQAERAWQAYPGVSIVRLSNVYGPGQRPDMAYATFLRRALLGQRIELRAGGKQRRTPTYIDDCIDGIVAVAGYEGSSRIFDVAGPQNTRLVDVPSLLGRLLARSVPTTDSPPAPGDPLNATVSNALADGSSGTSRRRC